MLNPGTPLPTVMAQNAPFRDGRARIREARGEWLWDDADEALRELREARQALNPSRALR